MKKFTLILTAALVSLSVLATDVQKISFSETQLKAADVEKVSVLAESTPRQLVSAPAAPTSVKKAPQSKLALSNLTLKESGIGIFSFTFEGGTSTYLQGSIYNEQGERVAYAAYAAETFKQYITSSYNLIRYGNITDASYVSGYTLLPGTYYFDIFGHDGSSITEEHVTAQITLSMNAETYAITDLTAELQADGKAKVSWATATTPIPEEWWYEVVISGAEQGDVYDSYTDTDPAIGGFGTLTATTLTPDTVLNEDYYTVRVSIWTAEGFRGGNNASTSLQVGENPYTPTILVATPDNETMTATLTWEGITTYYLPTLKDANGKVWGYTSAGAYQFSSGDWYCAAKTLTTETLPAGTYTWQIVPAIAHDNTLYSGSDPVEGPSFEIKDITAPVIDSVFVASTSDTEVSLGIVVADNAPDVTPADLVFNVTGDITLEDAKLEEDETLKLSGLTPQVYHIQITATDPSGNKSAAFAFEFTPISDTEAPTNLTAELDSVSDKFVTVKVSAEDNVATAEQLIYIFTFADGSTIETNTTTGLVTLDDLTPETEYEVIVKVKDFGGNVSADSVVLSFTTLELIPIEIYFDYLTVTKYANYDDEKGHNFTIGLYTLNEAGTALTYPFVQFDIYTEEPLTITGTYSAEKNNLDVSYSRLMFSSSQRVNMTDATLFLKFLGNTTVQGTVSPIFYGYYEFMGDDGNIYVGAFRKNCYPDDNDDNSITLTDSIADTDSPELWVNEEYPVEVEGTTVEIMFGAWDGPYYSWLSWDAEPYSTIENLILTVKDSAGTVLASTENGTIVNTPTLDEDGAYYFTATLSNLEEETDYVVTINAVDEAGNVAEPIEVSFTTGQAQGIEDIDSTVKAQKRLRNAQLIIERNGKEYNATGVQIK